MGDIRRAKPHPGAVRPAAAIGGWVLAAWQRPQRIDAVIREPTFSSCFPEDAANGCPR